MNGIADTGFLVAFANARDRHHDWAVTIAGRVDAPLLTCEPVLAEKKGHPVTQQTFCGGGGAGPPQASTWLGPVHQTTQGRPASSSFAIAPSNTDSTSGATLDAEGWVS